MAVEAAEQLQGFFDGELVGELGFLELDADALAEFVGAGGPVEAKKLDCAFVGRSQPFADFDGCGLPCSVGTEQAKALT